MPSLNPSWVLIAFVLSVCAIRSEDLAAGEFQKFSHNERLSGSTVSGIVSVAGNHQAPQPLPVFKNRSFCGTAVRNETLLVGPHGGLRNAVVALHALDQKAAAPPTRVVLDNQRCAFLPHVQVAPLGSELLLKNSDPILHTVHARIGRETLFNVGLPRWRQVTKRLDRVGRIRIDCDVLHTWMSAVIIVTRTPYVAVSDEHGKFVVDGLPAGSYEVEIWHEKLGMKWMKLVVPDDRSISLDVVFAVPQKS